MRENAHLINCHLNCSIKNQVGTTNDGSVDLAAGKGTARKVCGVHGRGASRVDSKAILGFSIPRSEWDEWQHTWGHKD